ncbi:MAG: type II toxin-antitoxin system HicB family antitoxin [Bacteroidales bacterium]|nr:type II toxin-antitoxin system HicB family antitoxin [Bacteroidales bacterium]
MKNILKYKGFIGSVNFSPNDRVFFGKLEGIEDLVTFEGTSVDELETAFKEVVDLHISDCEKEGKPLKKVFHGSFNIRIGSKLHQKVYQKAVSKGISLNQLVKKALEHEIENERE